MKDAAEANGDGQEEGPSRSAPRHGRGATFAARQSSYVVEATRTSSELDTQLRTIVAGRLGDALRVQLAARNRDCAPDEIEDAVQTACDLAIRNGRSDMAEGELYSWLRTTAGRWLYDQRLARRHEVPVDPGDTDLFEEHAGRAVSTETTVLIAEHARERAELAHVVVADLSPRQRDVLALHCRGQKRPTIARALGLSPRQVKREIESIMRTARGAVGQAAGGGCDQGEAIVLRRACGLASAREAAQARRHAASCGRCRELADRLDLWREIPAILPLPAAVDNGAANGVTDAVAAIRAHVADGLAQAKQQAASAYYRLTDPTPLAGTRPGAVAAIVAGCVTVGTGTYCVENDVNPLTAVGIFSPAAPTQPAPKERDERASVPLPEPVVETTPAAPTPSAETTEAPATQSKPAETVPEPTSPAPVPPSGGDSLSGLSGNPTPAPAPAPPPPPTTGGGTGSSGTTFGGL